MAGAPVSAEPAAPTKPALVTVGVASSASSPARPTRQLDARPPRATAAESAFTVTPGAGRTGTLVTAASGAACPMTEDQRTKVARLALTDPHGSVKTYSASVVPTGAWSIPQTVVRTGTDNSPGFPATTLPATTCSTRRASTRPISRSSTTPQLDSPQTAAAASPCHRRNRASVARSG
jgi:hypothetical protein